MSKSKTDAQTNTAMKIPEVREIEASPYPGDAVVFYEQADVLVEPKAAIVTGFSAPGVLDLWTIPNKSATGIARRNVHHVESEELRNNENVRRRFGGWDFAANAKRRYAEKREKELRVVREANERKKRREERLRDPSEADVAAILDCRAKNMAPQEIAEKMGAPWNADAVSAVLRKHSSE